MNHMNPSWYPTTRDRCHRRPHGYPRLSAQDTWRQSLELFVQDLALAEEGIRRFTFEA